MKLTVILHDIRSLHNVGSIFRTADAVGVEKIYLCGITPSPFDRLKDLRPDFAKVALGAEKDLAWGSIKDTAEAINRSKEEGCEIFAVEQSEQSVPYYEVVAKTSSRVAIVLGSEVDGLPSSLLSLADRVLEIPMLGSKESLNVGVAFGIVAFHLRFDNGKMQ